jgi:hypothetical protein
MAIALTWSAELPPRKLLKERALPVALMTDTKPSPQAKRPPELQLTVSFVADPKPPVVGKLVAPRVEKVTPPT